ncbi:MAG: helix-turn-helix transcriptional regulator [Actinomycetes bacterium]
MTKIGVVGVGEYIREQRSIADLSLRQLAIRAGVSNPYLSQVERGLRKPSAEILSQIAKALRISAETLYIKAGILEEYSGDISLITALMADTTISDRQRRVLLEIYRSFQQENAAHEQQAATEPSSPRKG